MAFGIAYLLALQLFGHKQEGAPLPAEAAEAKTIFIANRAGYQGAADEAYQELKQWGRFEVVNDAKKADITVVLIQQSTTMGGDYAPPLTNTWFTAEYLLKGQQDPFLTTREMVMRFRKSPIKRCIDDLQKRLGPAQ